MRSTENTRGISASSRRMNSVPGSNSTSTPRGSTRSILLSNFTTGTSENPLADINLQSLSRQPISVFVSKDESAFPLKIISLVGSGARSLYCFDVCSSILSVVFSLNHAGEAPLASRGYQALNSPGGVFLPSFLPSRVQEETRSGRGCADTPAISCGDLTSSHVDGDEFGTVGDRKTFVSFTSPRRGKSSFSRTVKWETATRPVNANKEGTHFFSRYFLALRQGERPYYWQYPRYWSIIDLNAL